MVGHQEVLACWLLVVVDLRSSSRAFSKFRALWLLIIRSLLWLMLLVLLCLKQVTFWIKQLPLALLTTLVLVFVVVFDGEYFEWLRVPHGSCLLRCPLWVDWSRFLASCNSFTVWSSFIRYLFRLSTFRRHIRWWGRTIVSRLWRLTNDLLVWRHYSGVHDSWSKLSRPRWRWQNNLTLQHVLVICWAKQVHEVILLLKRMMLIRCLLPLLVSYVRDARGTSDQSAAARSLNPATL